MITNNYTPYAGGVVRAIQTYTHELQRQGHTVYIITLDFGVSDDPWFVFRVPSFVRWRYRDNIMVIPWRPYYYVDAYIYHCNPDIVHVHSPFILGNAGVRAARKRGIPTVFTYHSLYERFVCYAPVPQGITQRLVLSRVHAFCNCVDLVIAPSTYIAQRVSGVVDSPVTRLPTPIRQSFFYPMYRRNHNAIQRYIISVGRFQPEKRTHYVIDAFAKAYYDVPARLVLIGFGASYDYLRWYAHVYRRLSYDDVIFVVNPEQSVLLRWYQSADLFVSASQEAQGLVFAEALVCSVPVIAFRGAGVDDIVQHGSNGFLVHNTDDMAYYISRAYHDARLLTSLRESAYTTGLQYHPMHGARRLSSIYTTLMSRSGNHAGEHLPP